MIKTSLGLGFVFALFSSIAGAASLDTTQIQISSQVYAEDPCNFTYATRGAFSIEVDVASIEAQLGQSVTEVEVIYGYFGRWTKEFQIDKNPQRVEMARSEDNASRFVVTFSDFLAKKGRFQHDGIDFLFRAELDGGEVVDLAPAGFAQFYSATIPYNTAKCSFEESVWDSLSLGVAGPEDRRN
jgi:hypothetical protein